MTTSSNDRARARLPVPMVALFGSALRPGTAARDLDVVYGGLTAEEATQAVRSLAPEFAHLPLDLHESRWEPPVYVMEQERFPGRYQGVQGVDATDVVRPLLGASVAPQVWVAWDSLPRALRWFARHGEFLLGSAYLDIASGETRSNYQGRGLQALRTAWGKLGVTQRAAARAHYGPVLECAIKRNPTPQELRVIGPTLMWTTGERLASEPRRPYSPTGEVVRMRGGQMALVGPG